MASSLILNIFSLESCFFGDLSEGRPHLSQQQCGLDLPIEMDLHFMIQNATMAPMIVPSKTPPTEDATADMTMVSASPSSETSLITKSERLHVAFPVESETCRWP